MATVFSFTAMREPNLHIHVEIDNSEAKFWLEPVELAKSYGFKAKEINQLTKLVSDSQQQFKQAWDEYFTR
jgi:hypothetical protein